MGLDESDCAEPQVSLPSYEGILHAVARSRQEPGAPRIRSRRAAAGGLWRRVRPLACAISGSISHWRSSAAGQKDADYRQSPKSAPMTGTQNGKSILLAEDERPLRKLVLKILRAAGYNVIVAADGRDGLEKSRQFNGTIHLLLSDVEMPNMTGIELATQIQIVRPEIPS